MGIALIAASADWALDTVVAAAVAAAAAEGACCID